MFSYRPELFFAIGALIVAAIATYTDVRKGKIYNILTFPAALIGIITRAAVFALMATPSSTSMVAGLNGAWTGVLGWLAGVAIMSLTKIFLRQMGHGDSKLMGAFGAFVGPSMIVVVWFWYSLSYGVYFLPMLIAFPWSKLAIAIQTKNLRLIIDDDKFKASRNKVHPVAPLITAGLVIGILLERQTLQFFGFK